MDERKLDQLVERIADLEIAVAGVQATHKTPYDPEILERQDKAHRNIRDRAIEQISHECQTLSAEKSEVRE